MRLAADQDSTLLAEIRLGAAWLRLDTVFRAQLRAALDAVERDQR